MHTGSSNSAVDKARFQNELRRLVRWETAAEMAGKLDWCGEDSTSRNRQPPELGLWLGPPGHTEHLHMDGYSNIHFQLRGIKTWRLFPPRSNLCPVPVSSSLSRDGSQQHNFSTLTLEQARQVAPDMMTIVVKPGEAIFVPAGWWHHVQGASDDDSDGDRGIVASVNWFEPSSAVPWTRMLSWHFLRLHVGDWIGQCSELVRTSLLGQDVPVVEMPPAAYKTD